MTELRSVEPDLSPDESRELARLAAAAIGVLGLFAMFGAAIAVTTGDISSAAAAALDAAAISTEDRSPSTTFGTDTGMRPATRRHPR
jgi:hypothetical protein